MVASPYGIGLCVPITSSTSCHQAIFVDQATDDLLGSVRGTVSGAGSLTASALYDAWGNPDTSGGSHWMIRRKR